MGGDGVVTVIGDGYHCVLDEKLIGLEERNAMTENYKHEETTLTSGASKIKTHRGVMCTWRGDGN